jgi:hypothetical protein
LSIETEALRPRAHAARDERWQANTVSRLLGDYQVPICGFAASRLALFVVGMLTQIFIRPIVAVAPPDVISRHEALNVWARWDSAWYMSLAAHGYQSAAEVHGGQANWAFFPAYPAIAALVARMTHLPILPAMLVVSNVSFLLALVLVHRLARAEFDQRTADLAVILLCAAPGSYIFSSAYTESLFLAAIAAALLLLRSRRWLAAGLAGGVAVLTRNVGIGLLLPFAWAGGVQIWTLRRGWRPAEGRDLLRLILGAAIPVIALACLCLVLQARTGDPLAFINIQKAWSRTVGNPFLRPLRGLFAPGSIPDTDLINFAAGWMSFALLLALAAMRRWALLSLALFMTLTPLATGLSSYARYSLVVVPLWLAAARLLAAHPAAILPTVLFMAMINGFMMVAWTLALFVTT